MEFMQEIVRQEEKRLNIDSLETLIGSTIAEFTKTIISMSGLALSNINSNNDINTKDKHCECGKKLTVNKKAQRKKILSIFGEITVIRDKYYCTRCDKGYGENDEIIGLDRGHRLTKGIIEAITYASQLVPFFERASDVLKKFST